MVRVEAAGCVVLRRTLLRTRVLLVWTRGYADPTLPKGSMEPGETALECALGEVTEETGYTVEVTHEEPVVVETVMDKYPPFVHKTVRFFVARPLGGSPALRLERSLVARVGWVAVSRAVNLMRRPEEIEALRRCLVLARSVRVPPPAGRHSP